MKLKFIGTLEALKNHLQPLKLSGEWQSKPNGVWIFRSEEKAGLLWSETKGTVWFDGPPTAKAALSAKVQTVLADGAVKRRVSANGTTFVVHDGDRDTRQREDGQINTVIPGFLAERHFAVFGKIVQLFAHIELLMQEIIAAVIGLDSATVIALTERLDFSEKQEALITVLIDRRVPVDHINGVRVWLELLTKLHNLSDEIQYSAWVAGPSSNSIQPDCVGLRPPTYKPITAEDKWVHDFEKVGHMRAIGEREPEHGS